MSNTQANCINQSQTTERVTHETHATYIITTTNISKIHMDSGEAGGPTLNPYRKLVIINTAVVVVFNIFREPSSLSYLLISLSLREPLFSRYHGKRTWHHNTNKLKQIEGIHKPNNLRILGNDANIGRLFNYLDLYK